MSPGKIFIGVPMIDEAVSLSTNLAEIAMNGKRGEKWLLWAGVIFVSLAAFMLVMLATGYPTKPLVPLIIGTGILGLAFTVASGASYEYRQVQARSQIVSDLQERARSEPAEPQLAWDLARIKLESYLDRNLRQVSSIYYLTLLVMIFGMTLIGVGVGRAIMVPEAMQAAGLAALAGVVVQIIGGTILLIYRSTMAQAKDYVIVLERINAVGMSINILEGIQGAASMRDEARVELSTTLLGMYSTTAGKPKALAKAKRKSAKKSN